MPARAAEDAELERALDVLRRGGVVAAATESFFGLLADALSTQALDRVFALKPRGTDQGVPLLLPRREAWGDVAASVSELAARMADQGWPGPLTIAVPARPEVDQRLTLGGTVAVRLPGPSPAQRLVEQFGRPVTASSANLPGEPPAVTSEQVLETFSGVVRTGELHVLPGQAPGGKPSTLIRVDESRVTIVRAGAIAESEIRAMEHARRSLA